MGDAPITDAALLAMLPTRAREMIGASTDLHRRVALMDEAQDMPAVIASPVRSMQKRIASAF
uniref:DUF1465 family protein n=1 Tax=Sphingomonas sp. H160509 TaxID=2955313 RepID=UPI003158D238